jgi:hypothetical protein
MKKGVKSLKIKIILISIILIVLIFAIWGYAAITGRAISPLPNCGFIQNSKCKEDAPASGCLLLFARISSFKERNTAGCVLTWAFANPDRASEIVYLQQCAIDFREKKITESEWNYCYENWNKPREEVILVEEKIAASYTATIQVENEIGLFTESGNYFVYLANYNKWVEKTNEVMKGEFLNNSFWFSYSGYKKGVLPQNLKVIESYYFQPTNEIELWGELNGKPIFLVYNSSTKEWQDKTKLVMIGTYYNSSKRQWCSKTKCGVVPENFKVISGYYFNSADGGRINLIGTVNGDKRFLIYNPSQKVWHDRTTDIFSGASGRLPKDFIPETSFYIPSESIFSTGGEVYLYGNNKLYILDINSGTFSEKNLSYKGLPQKIPQAGYYDEWQRKIIIWYSDKEVYMGDRNSFNKSEDYLFKGGLPHHGYYLECNEKKLTPEQKELLEIFNKEFQNISNEDERNIQKEYPWINPKNLNICDKIFLIKELENIFNAMGVLGSY